MISKFQQILGIQPQFFFLTVGQNNFGNKKQFHLFFSISSILFYLLYNLFLLFVFCFALVFFCFSLDPWDVTPADAPKDQKKGQSKGQKSLKALKSVILKSPTSPIHPSPPVAPPSGKTASRPRTQSNINPPNLMSAASAASIASYPSSGSGNASAATSVVVTSGMASSPKSPIIAEVSPAYRRWSEATASIDTSASGGKKNNEWSSNFERSYMEMEGK